MFTQRKGVCTDYVEQSVLMSNNDRYLQNVYMLGWNWNHECTWLQLGETPIYMYQIYVYIYS